MNPIAGLQRDPMRDVGEDVEIARIRQVLQGALERLDETPVDALWLVADAGALIAERLVADEDLSRLLDIVLSTGCSFRLRPEAGMSIS